MLIRVSIIWTFKRAAPVVRHERDPDQTPQQGGRMATSKLAPAFAPAQVREFPPVTISSQEIARYAELSALVSELEKQPQALRAELLALHAAGAEQATDCPYLLAFVEQERRTADWKAQALALAEKLYGVERAASWKAQVEQSAPVQPVTSIRVKPNPAYASGLRKSAQPVQAMGYGDCSCHAR